MTQVKSYILLIDEKQWFWYCNYEQDFNDRQLCTRIEKRFYNREYNDWGEHADYYGTIYNNRRRRQPELSARETAQLEHRRIYAYEQDSILVQNYFYHWDNEKWNMSTGERDYYDYDTPLSDVIIWLGYNGYHKMDKMLTYIPGTDEDFYVNNYCYSTVQATSIHGMTTANVAIRVYPTLVDNGFTVEAPADTEVRIFSTNGTCLAKTKAGYIPAQSLPAGLYVVVAGGTKTKIVKK